MSKLSWVKWSAGDFLNGVVGMSAEEIGVYAVVLNLIYDKGGPIKNDPDRIARRCAMRPTSFAKVFDRLLDAEKLSIHDGMIVNSRAVRVLETRTKVVENWKKNLLPSDEKENTKTSKNNGITLPLGVPFGGASRAVELESVEKKERKKDIRPAKKQDTDPYPEEFEALWRLYPRTKNTSKKKAHDIWRMLNAENQEKVRIAVPLYAAAMRAEGRPEDKIKHMQFWLSERVYETVGASAPAAKQASADWYKTASRPQWEKLLVIWRSDMNWRPAWGPAPGRPGCGVPADLLTDIEKGLRSHRSDPRKEAPALV